MHCACDCMYFVAVRESGFELLPAERKNEFI